MMIVFKSFCSRVLLKSTIFCLASVSSLHSMDQASSSFEKLMLANPDVSGNILTQCHLDGLSLPELAVISKSIQQQLVTIYKHKPITHSSHLLFLSRLPEYRDFMRKQPIELDLFYKTNVKEIDDKILGDYLFYKKISKENH